jgi:hypothetical protein
MIHKTIKTRKTLYESWKPANRRLPSASWLASRPEQKAVLMVLQVL